MTRELSRLIPLLLLGGAVHAQQLEEKQQQVIVAVRLDAAGRVMEARPESGNPGLYERAVQAAEEAKYRADCDERGKPIPSSTRVFVLFDERGSFVKLQFPIVVGDTLRGTKLLKRVHPQYPKHLRRAGVQGLVVLQVWIDEKGRVTRAEVLRGHDLLSEYAVKAVLQWRYEPTFMKCDAIPVVATVTLPFVIR